MHTYSPFRLALLLATGTVCCLGDSAFAEVSVIVNAANKATPDKEQIKALFLGTARRWPDESAAKPVDLPAGNATRNDLYEELLGKSDMEMKMYWSTTIFTGAGIPPKAVGNDKDVVKFVEENPGAIGYVDSTSAGSGVRVVLTVK